MRTFLGDGAGCTHSRGQGFGLGGGDDTVIAGDGNNDIHAGRGNNTITTGGGDDRIWTDGGTDLIDAGDGDNEIHSGRSNDFIITGYGNDRIWTDGGDDIVHAGAGNDIVQGGSGNDILVGGDGDDQLIGGDGRDMLIGGFGSDHLVGNASEDLLIAGYTAYDNIDLALIALMQEWSSGNSYATRIANLQAGTGLANGSRLNGDDGALQTVFNDNDGDTLTGSQGQDWFLANQDADNGGALDVVTDKAGNEVWSDTDF